MSFPFRTFLVVLAACSWLAACRGTPSDRCLSSSECDDGEACVAEASGSQRCLKTCDANTSVRCEGGQLCAVVAAEDARASVCLPGGATAIGTVCTTSFECVLGAICFQPEGGSEFACRASCEVGGVASCAATETCTSVGSADSPSRGVCLVSAP